MPRKSKPVTKTIDEKIQELRVVLDAEVDQVIYERAEEVLEDLEWLSSEVLAAELVKQMAKPPSGSGKQRARDLRRMAVYALLVASRIDAVERKAGG